MSDRDSESAREQDIDTEMPLAGGNGLGGTLPIYEGDQLDEHEPTATDEALDDEQDSESAENDDGLLDGRSPEFQHLTKPTHGDRK